MIDNIIYGLGTLSFAALALSVFFFMGLVAFGICAGMIESIKSFNESRKRGKQ
ncbi:MAG: hypothetical protein ABS882_03525 [Lysinibacillus sp.]